MTDPQVYQELANHLDKDVLVGAPMSESLLGILEILFPRVESEIGARLPMQNKTLSELEELFPEQAKDLGEILERMAYRGTVFSSQKPGHERVWRLLPILVGWAETPFWAGRDNEDVRKLAPLWMKYREEGLADELARGVPTVRVIPVGQSLKDNSEILPFDAIKPLLENVSYFSVAHCPCRQIKRFTGEGCDHETENCLHFGSMGRYMVEYGMARKITREETLEILAKAEKDGLVHNCDNLDGHLSTVCNCCSCCCVFLGTKKLTGLQTYDRSNYFAQVDADVCAACGTCIDRCPVEAISRDEDDRAVVDETICVGCGVCTPTCPTEAIGLVRRAEVKPPPDVNGFLTARYKTG
jgi:electron transport complex protein RnfB